MAFRPSRRLPARRTSRPLAATVGALVVCGLSAVAGVAAPAAADRAGAPGLAVQVVQRNLDIPWDLAFTDSTHYLLNERPGRLWLANTNPAVPRQRVAADFSGVVTIASGGLMGMVVDPGFATNRLFYTCQTNRTPKDVRVVRWRLSADGTRAVRSGTPVISGIPLGNPHYGCRLLFLPDGSLLVGTGDAALASGPQSLTSLAGKILRVLPNGSAPRDNPWASATSPKRFVWNYGHRNVQGLAARPGTTQVFSAEHGPDWDDEINLVLKARNYGWDPKGPDGYNQDVPMTDLEKFPNAVPAKWTSGASTIAASGISFVTGSAWGTYSGQLFAALLKDEGVLALALDAAGNVRSTAQVPELNDRFGRLRTVRQAPDGSLYVLTANGSTDQVLRVTPK